MAARQSRTLIRLAESTEEVAAGLHNFREVLPRHATQITASLSELSAISTALREVDQAQNNRDYAPSFYRIRDDVGILIPSLERTLTDVLDMFSRSSSRPFHTVWEDLRYHMEQEEGLGLHERLSCYRDFLQAQLEIIRGFQPQSLRDLKRQLLILRNAQEAVELRPSRPVMSDSCTLGSYSRYLA